MKYRRLLLCIVGLLLVPVLSIRGQDKLPLKLIQTIPLPGVKGRMDHLGVDVTGKRLFAAALENSTVEVIDLKANKRIFSIPSQTKPQGIFYSVDFKRLFVANGGDGTCRVFREDTFQPIDSLPIGTNANHVGYDPVTKYLYVGVGNATSGALSVIDTSTSKHIGDIKTADNPLGIKVEKMGPRIFVAYARVAKISVLDRKKREEIASWPATGVGTGNVALALDEARHRLFAGSRNPPMLTVFDTESGNQLTQLEGVAGIDDLWYDAAHKRVYASGGRDVGAGFVYVYQVKDADHYVLMAKVPSRDNAQTSIWVPQLNRYYVSASANDKEDAAILVFEPQN